MDQTENLIVEYSNLEKTELIMKQEYKKELKPTLDQFLIE
jgi:hypothetical protein